MSALQHVWRVGGHVKHVVIDGQAVLMDTKTDSYFGLDEIGTLIWDQLRDSATTVAIAEQLAHRYDVSAEVVCADLERFLRELHARGLVTPVVPC
jgi:hypothetical protein